MTGWPDTPSGIACEYHNFRDELSMYDGVIYKGDRAVIPPSLRGEILRKLHSAHQGIQASIRRARESVFWPGMGKDTETFVQRCAMRNANPTCNQKQPMIAHEILGLPWNKIASDLFEHQGKDFLVTVDYYSDFFEVDILEKKDGLEVIRKLKAHMARHGVQA